MKSLLAWCMIWLGQLCSIVAGFLTKVGTVIDKVGSLAPWPGVGTVATFIASGLTLLDKRARQSRASKLASFAMLPNDKLEDVIHKAGVLLAHRYKMQIVMLDENDIRILSFIAITRAFEHLGSTEKDWMDLPDPIQLANGARLGRSGAFVDDLTNTNLGTQGWTAEGLLGRTAVIHKGQMFVDGANKKIDPAKYGPMLLEDDALPSHVLKSPSLSSSTITTQWVAAMKDFESEQYPLPASPKEKFTAFVVDVVGDVVEQRLMQISLTVETTLMPKIEDRFVRLEVQVAQIDVKLTVLTKQVAKLRVLELGDDNNHNLSQKNPHFVEREGMSMRMTGDLVQHGRLVICGPGGTGKSQIAKHYAYERLKDGYYHVVWRMEARSAVELTQGYSGLARLLGVDVEKLELPQIVHLIHERLNNDSRLRNWLLIYDDAKTEDLLLGLLGGNGFPTRVSSTHVGHVLVTSRSPNWSNVPRPIALDSFADSDALTFLSKVLPGSSEGDHMALSKYLRNHPLMLSQAAGFIVRSRPHVSIRDYCSKVQHHSGTVGLKKHVKAIFTDDYNETVDSIVQLSIEEMTKSSALSTSLIDLISVMGSAPVPESVLVELVKTIGQEQDYEAAITLCEDYALIVRVDEVGQAGYQMHELTSEARRSVLQQPQIHSLVLQWCNILFPVFDSEMVASPELGSIQQSLLSHVQALVMYWMMGHEPSKSLPQDEQKSWLDVATLLDRVGYCSFNRHSKFDQAFKFLQEGLDIRLAVVGESHPATASSYSNLGRGYNRKGEYDRALEFYYNALKIRLVTLGEKHPDTASSYSSIGRAYNSKGEYDKAIEFHNKSLKIRLATLGEKHPDTATSYNNIGYAYSGKGEYDKAIDFLNNALRVRLITLREKHPDTATSYNNIGYAYTGKGEYDKAIDFLNNALRVRLVTLGESHPDTATTFSDIGRVYSGKGEYDKAIDFYNKSLKIRVVTLGENHPSTASSYNNIGYAYSGKGEYDKAIEFYNKSLKIRLVTLDESHPDTATSYNNIGYAYSGKGEYDKAIDFYNKSLKIRVVALGEDHPSTATSYNNIGLAFFKKGEHDKAIGFFNKSLKIRVVTLGENHPDTATTYDSIGNAFDGKGDYDKTIKFHDKSLKIRLATLGEKHPDTATSYNNIGYAYSNKGEYDKAIKFHENALKIRLVTLGESHPDTATSYNNIGDVYFNRQEYDKAIDFLNKSLKIRLVALGEKHPSTATSYHNIGNVHFNKGEYDKAIEFFNKSLKIFLATLGENHPRTRACYESLEEVRRRIQ